MSINAKVGMHVHIHTAVSITWENSHTHPKPEKKCFQPRQFAINFINRFLILTHYVWMDGNLSATFRILVKAGRIEKPAFE